MPTKLKPGDLTFGELRLASMLCVAGRIPEPDIQPPVPDYTKILLTLDKPRIEKMVSEMVIQADRIALAKGVDLAQAVRNRLDPTKSGAAFNMRVRVPVEGDPKEPDNDHVEGQRPGD